MRRPRPLRASAGSARRRPHWIRSPRLTYQQKVCRSKSRWPTKNGARTASQKIQLAKRKTLRPYACGECGGWHLTKGGRDDA